MKDSEILAQYQKEKLTAVRFRQHKVNNWMSNEQLYNGVLTPTLLTRSNLHVPKIFDGINTLASRLGDMPTVDYDTKPDHDENAADIMENLYVHDSRRSDFDYLVSLSKIEAGLYGTSLFQLIPRNDGCAFELIDTMSFLISPLALTIKSAYFLGKQFIYKTIDQLEAEADAFEYDKKVIKKLKKLPADSETQQNNSAEASQRNLRLANLGFTNVSDLGTKVIDITEWYTTIEGEKRVLTVANDAYILRNIPLTDIGVDEWPFASWSFFPRGVTFWVPSPADVLRDPNLALDVILNQVVDNNTYRNFGMIFADSASGLKQGSIVPRPLGVTPVTIGMGKGIKDAVWQFSPPEIQTAQGVFQMINSLAESAAGISLAPINQRGKIPIAQLQTQMAALEQRTDIARDNMHRAIRELAQMYADSIKKNLTTPRTIKIYGYQAMTLQSVTKKNFKGVEFIAKTTPPESVKENKAVKQKAYVELYQLFRNDPLVPGQRFLREEVAKEVGMMDAGQREKLFTAETPLPGQPIPGQPQPGQPQPGQPGQPQPQSGQSQIPQNPENPALSAGAAATAAAQPPQLKPM